MTSKTPASPASLVELLDLEKIEENIFRGHSPMTAWKRVFGGLVISQALVAANRTVEGRSAHSLHGYFILPGDPEAPIIYQVERVRDGRSFTTRRCAAIQHGQTIFVLAASYQIEEAGLDHAAPMPDVPGPDEVVPIAELRAKLGDRVPARIVEFLDRERPIEFRPVDPARYLPLENGERRPPCQRIWFRATERLPDDADLHRAVLAYMSDMTLLDSVLVTHGRTVFDGTIQAASLDHALWFHRPFRADDWLLYSQTSPNAGGGRGLAIGQIHDRSGQFVASVAQEGLIRLRQPR